MLAKNGIEVARNAGLMPIDVMLARMRGELLPNGRSPNDEQFQAAIAAAPFLHPRLSAVAFQEGKSRARFDTSVLSQQERVQLLDYLRRMQVVPGSKLSWESDGAPMIEVPALPSTHHDE